MKGVGTMTKTILMAGAAVLALTAAPAWAQQDTSTSTAAGAATAPENASDVAPAEIIVTAQKRAERLQDVPVAVSVISGAAIANQGAVNLENAQYLVPSLNFRKSGVAINQSLFLRGVGTSTFSIAGEPSVSTVVDGVVFSRAGEAFSDLVDIERIEVLRGPQGTLFGKNASAGVVNIVTRKPTDEFEGSLEASYFDRNEYRARGIVNVPFAEDAGFRLVGFYSSYDGNIFNAAANVRDYVNGYKRYGFRGIVTGDILPGLRATVIGDWRKTDDDCCAEVIGTAPTGLGALALAGTQFAGDESRTIRQNQVTRSIQESYGVSVQLDAELGDNTVTSISAWRRFDENEIRDGDFVDAAYNGLNQLHDVGPQTGRTFSQELRLTSPGRQFIDYVLGAYYSTATTQRTFTRNDIVCNSAPAPTVLVPCGSAGAPPSTFPTGTATFGSTFRNFAVFGQAQVNVTEALRLIAGLRYTDDQLDVFHRRVTALAGPGIQPNFDAGVFNGSFVGPAGPSNGVFFRNKVTNDNLSGKAGVQFDFSRDVMAYATYARGYKGPAFNVFFNLTAIGAGPIAPETSDSYEIGLKNTLFGGRLVLNLAGYYAKYRNFQANNPDIVAGVLVTRFTNAGDISTRGFEADLLWRPADDLTISGGLAYTDAKVDQFRVPPGGNPAAVVPSGTTLAYAPKWKTSLGVDYRYRTGGAVDFTVGGDVAYQSSQLSQFDPNPAIRTATTIGAYALANLSAGIVSSDDRFRLLVQVRNVFDQSFAAAITSGGPGGSYRYLIPREADRFWGVTAKVGFGGSR